MTKLCGYISAEGEPIGATLQTMIERMRHTAAASPTIACFGLAGLAVLTPDPAARLVGDPSRQTCLALAGYLLDAPDLNGVLAAWDQRGPAILEQLDGDFVLAHYHQPTQTLTLASSFFGPVPLYYMQTPRGLAFASETKALLPLLASPELDWDAVADFFYLGHMLGNRTLFEGIQALGAAEVLTYSRGQLNRRSYADFTRTPVLAEAEVSTGRLAELFQRAVERRQGTQPQTVLLSGGMDSRLILGTLRRAGSSPRLIALEHGNERQGADGRYAQAIARHLGLECELRRTRPDFYTAPECLEVFYILDGMVPSWELFISQVYAELDQGLGIIWEGMGLGSALGCAHQQAGGVARNMTGLLEKRVANRRLLRQALTPEAFARLDAGFMERLHGAIAAIPPSQNQYLHFLLQHRIRRRIAPNPYQLFACKVEPRTPGTDRDFLSYVLSIPTGMKLDHRLYRQLYQQYFPELTAVPIVTGGSPLSFDQGATGLAQQYSERAIQALKQISRRYNLKRRLKRAFARPLTADEQAFAPTIKATLEQVGFDRPFYNTAALRSRFDQYRSGNLRYHDLFALVFYIEQWHRLFLQPDASVPANLPGASVELAAYSLYATAPQAREVGAPVSSRSAL